MQTAQEGTDVQRESDGASELEVTQAPVSERLLIDTNASNKTDGGFWVPHEKGATVHDAIIYDGATAGVTYTVKGEMHVVDDMGVDGGVAKDTVGNPITAQGIFTADGEKGSTSLDFSFDASGMSVERLCVFEWVYRDGVEVADHASTSNVSQLITIAPDGQDTDVAQVSATASGDDADGAQNQSADDASATTAITQTGDGKVNELAVVTTVAVLTLTACLVVRRAYGGHGMLGTMTAALAVTMAVLLACTTVR